jgi:hypothetical protein
MLNAAYLETKFHNGESAVGKPTEPQSASPPFGLLSRRDPAPLPPFLA